MSRWVLIFALVLAGSGCGDDGSGADPGADAGPRRDGSSPDTGTVVGRTFWVATDGDDANDGSEAAPFLSFGFAIAQLAPGDTLLVKDGDYGSLSWSCESNVCDGAPCPSGERGAPITIRAENERQVRLRGGGRTALSVRGCSWVHVEGFDVAQGDVMTETGAAAVSSFTMSDHLVVRRLLLHLSNRWSNSHVLNVINSEHVLVEENELYDFHRNGFMILRSDFVTLRRNYINSRDTPDIPGGFGSSCGSTGDSGYYIGGSYRTMLENNVTERVCTAYHVDPESFSSLGEVPRSSTGLRFLGNVALDAASSSFRITSDCDGDVPCPEEKRTSDVEIIDGVSIRTPTAFYGIGVERLVLRNVTSIDASRDFRMERGTGNEDVMPSFTILNALDVGADGVGYDVVDQSEGTIAGGNSFGNTDDFPSGMEYLVGTHGVLDPALGDCTVYAPAASPIRGAGLGGADVGAQIVDRYVDGFLSDAPLWDSGTSAFPCGAVIVASPNDPALHADATCGTVHERLSVGAATCPLP